MQKKSFKDICGEDYDDQKGHVCDYKPDGYHCNGNTSKSLPQSTIDNEFLIYKNASEGRKIFDRERGYYRKYLSSKEKKLFISRVRFNLGQGSVEIGVELFDSFMPFRSVLTDSARTEYDTVLNNIFQHLMGLGVGLTIGDYYANRNLE